MFIIVLLIFLLSHTTFHSVDLFHIFVGIAFGWFVPHFDMHGKVIFPIALIIFFARYLFVNPVEVNTILLICGLFVVDYLSVFDKFGAVDEGDLSPSPVAILVAPVGVVSVGVSMLVVKGEIFPSP